MRKFSLIFLAVAAALAISPEAFSQTYDFTFISPTIDIANGVITLSPTPAVLEGVGPGNVPIYSYDIASVSGAYSGPDGVSGSISLYPGWGANSSQILSVSGWEFDNQFYPGANAPGTNGAVFDVGGLFMYVGSSTVSNPYIANLWAGNIDGEPGSPNSYTIEQGQLGVTNNLGYDTGIGLSNAAATPDDSNFNLTRVPESGSLSMLVLSIVALAGGFFFKARHSGLLLNA
jgi:hypothetical protein